MKSEMCVALSRVAALRFQWWVNSMRVGILMSKPDFVSWTLLKQKQRGVWDVCGTVYGRNPSIMEELAMV